MGWINKGVAAVWRAGHATGGLFRRAENDTPPGPEDNYWYGPVGQSNHAGVKVTPDIALKASALYTVVKIIAETMATLPLRMHRELGDDEFVREADHPLDDLLRYQPNRINTAHDFWATMLLHALLRGTAYAEIVPGQRGAVDQLIPLHADRVKVQTLRDRSLRFEVTNPHTGERRILLQEEMFRFPGMSSDGVSGLSAVDLAAEDIGLGLAADAFAARVFSNRLNIGGYLQHPGQLGDAAQKNLIKAFMDRLAGVNNAHRPTVLQEGMTFERGSDTPKDMQLLEARKFQITLIAQRWRVPLHMLGFDDQTNRSTVEAQALDFVKYTIQPWAENIEQAIRRDLIIGKGKFVAKFNMDRLLRGDSKAQAEYYSAALGSSGRASWMTPNEVRIAQGLPRLKDPRADMLGGMEPGEVFQDQPPASVAQANVARLVRKEATAMRKAATRMAGDPDGWREWVKAFFAGHISTTMEILQVPKETAKAYCEHVKEHILRANDTDGLLDHWFDGRAAEVEAEIKGIGNG